MLSSLYIGATGMKSLSEGMHVTGNNLANCSTVGFKSQMALYSDLIYEEQANPGEWNFNQVGSQVAVGQKGMGVRVDEIATNFTQGGFESTNSVTDLAINGTGYFVVQDEGGNNFYTRAGDFNVDNEGIMRTPNGMALMGVRLMDPEGSDTLSFSQNASENGAIDRSSLEAIDMDRFINLTPRATSKLTVTDTNLSPSSNVANNIENPYFSMLSAYDATSASPLPSSAYSNSQSVSLYDSEGGTHDVVIYYDGSASTINSDSVEFLVTEAVSQAESEGSGLLMSGVLQFNKSGQLTGLAAYTPTTEGSTDLGDWSSAALSDGGLPLLTVDGSSVALDFGISSNGGGWSGTGTAKDVGTDASKLTTLTEAVTTNHAVTGYSTSGFSSSISQDGYGEGVLSSYQIGTDGCVTGNFSNGQIIDLWQIPLARFTSDDGLNRQGDNLFSATAEAGQMDLGVPGSENYGNVVSYYIEQSNVDVSREMVNMIITQRGFQSNSKVVTTSDELLRTAINLKR